MVKRSVPGNIIRRALAVSIAAFSLSKISSSCCFALSDAFAMVADSVAFCMEVIHDGTVRQS